VVAIKPIESGCDGSHDLEDGTRLWRASGQGQPERALLSLRQPVAPPVAADTEGMIVDFDNLMQRCRELGRGAQVVLVEGAGGLLSPLTWHHTTVDIAQALHAPALVVAANRLGAINHVELVLEVLHQRGLPTLGVVLSSDVDDPSSSSNAAVLRRLRRGLRLYSLPRVADVDEAADNLGAVTDWLLAD
jgi:dethiobiotin synthase